MRRSFSAASALGPLADDGRQERGARGRGGRAALAPRAAATRPAWRPRSPRPKRPVGAGGRRGPGRASRRPSSSAWLTSALAGLGARQPVAGHPGPAAAPRAARWRAPTRPGPTVRSRRFRSSAARASALALRQLGLAQPALDAREVGRQPRQDHARVARPVLRRGGQARPRQGDQLGVGPAGVEPVERVGQVGPLGLAVELGARPAA